jgi:hypothetical protein
MTPRQQLEPVALGGDLDLLRLWDKDECDAFGHPNNWLFCSGCHGSGRQPPPRDDRACPICRGCGCVRDAVLAALGRRQLHARVTSEEPGRAPAAPIAATHLTRCEECNHPARAGEWADRSVETRDGYRREILRIAACAATDSQVTLRRTILAATTIHYSACDPECRAHPPDELRWATPGQTEWRQGPAAPGAARIQAAWRHVDVTFRSWPHDLRPGMLSVLCLRCRAEHAERGSLAA